MDKLLIPQSRPELIASKDSPRVGFTLLLGSPQCSLADRVKHCDYRAFHCLATVSPNPISSSSALHYVALVSSALGLSLPWSSSVCLRDDTEFCAR